MNERPGNRNLVLTAPVGANNNALRIESKESMLGIPHMSMFSFDPYAVGYTMDCIRFKDV